MSPRRCSRLVLATLIGVLAASTVALADPSARVARVSFIGGSVSFRPASLDEWSLASLNYPLTVGDHVWTDRGARSELQLGSTVVRIGPFTEFSLLNLDDRVAQLRVTQGAVSVRVRALSDSDVLEIDTPNGAVSLLRPGLYRVDVNEAGDSSTVTVREGEVDVATGATAFPLRRDQSAVLTGVETPRSDVHAAVRIDEFEDWCLTRDRRMALVQSGRYVSPDMIGYEDLDANGTWQVVADYGPVWTPRVRAEWVPYRFGHWAWVEPWGWTWIDDAPWGFAPFHYGRWVFLPARGWAWAPGTLVARPVYAPALVAFVGGSSWSASVGLGGAPIGWFPLGPREVFVPAYSVTPEYVQRVNVSHVTNVNVTNINVTNVTYVNRVVPGAVTAVSRETFVQARPVGAVAVAIPRDQAQAAAVIGAAPVRPQRPSVSGAPMTAPPPAAAVARQVVVRHAPPSAPTPSPTHAFVRAVAGPRPPGVQAGPTTPSNPALSPASDPAGQTNRRPPDARTAPAAGHPTAPQTVPDLATRHVQERNEIETRHAQERAALQARHGQEQHQATDASERAGLQQRHQQEIKALQARQNQERDATERRQQKERKEKGSDPR